MVFAANILHSENKQAISCVTVIHHHSVHNYNSSLHVDVNDLLEAGDLAIQHFAVFVDNGMLKAATEPYD